MAKEICRQYTLVIRGNDDDAFDEAINEFVRQLKDGCLEGKASNDTSAFYFNSHEHVHDGHRPA